MWGFFFSVFYSKPKMCLLKITLVCNYAYGKIIFISDTQIIKCRSGRKVTTGLNVLNPSHKATQRLALPLTPFISSYVKHNGE